MCVVVVVVVAGAGEIALRLLSPFTPTSQMKHSDVSQYSYKVKSSEPICMPVRRAPRKCAWGQFNLARLSVIFRNCDTCDTGVDNPRLPPVSKECPPGQISTSGPIPSRYFQFRTCNKDYRKYARRRRLYYFHFPLQAIDEEPKLLRVAGNLECSLERASQ